MRIRARNVNQAFNQVVGVFDDPALRIVKVISETSSRNGPVLVVNEPVTVTYERPRERVLFNTVRDCNPFFHLFESLWMLAGRNDVAALDLYNSGMKSYSDDGETFNGAYGYRWRHAKVADVHNLNVDPLQDQLSILITHLKQNPDSRRAVLQMWNVEDDLLKIDDQHEMFAKDVCCNLSVTFLIRDGLLDMTVFNRSNDAIWGMLGANVVHFSFLQEYVACSLGIEVGRYHQISSNLHVYTENNSGFTPNTWMEPHVNIDYYLNDLGPSPVPLVENQERFDRELAEFVDNTDWSRRWSEPFLDVVAAPICWAWQLHKRRDYSGAQAALDTCEALDWQLACRNWLLKREANWKNKGGT